MIGDPSGRQKTRPILSMEEVTKNGQTYVEQVSRILDREKLTVLFNSQWLNPMTFADVIKLAASYTVSQMLERNDFHERFNAEQPISLHEFLYPLAQGMDSVLSKLISNLAEPIRNSICLWEGSCSVITTRNRNVF